jgi:hypothetical protein
VVEAARVGERPYPILRCSITQSRPISAAHAPRQSDPRPLSPRATGTHLSSSRRVAPLPTGTPLSFHSTTPPCQSVPPITTAPPFFSLSPPRFPLRVKHAAIPYTSPLCILSEPVTGASPKPSVDIVHLPVWSSRRRAAPVDLRCRLYFDEHHAGALLLSDIQVDASELSSGRMSESPSASTTSAPSKKHHPHLPPHRCPTPLGEPRRHPSCPVTSLTVLILTPPTALHGSRR